MKVCPRCGGEKPKSEFGYRCAGEKKLNAWCSACRTEATHDRRVIGRQVKSLAPFQFDKLLMDFIHQYSRKAKYGERKVIRGYKFAGCVDGEITFGEVVSSVTQPTLKFGHPTGVEYPAE